MHCERAIELPRRPLRRGPGGIVAGRGVGLPGDDPAARPARHPLDRDRRSCPGPDAGFACRDPAGHVDERPVPLSRPIACSRRSDRRDRLPRSRPERPDRLPLPAQGARRRGGRRLPAARLHDIRRRVSTTCSRSRVSVILDGENCWEHYPDGGVPFLRALYGARTPTPDLRTVTHRATSSEHPPRTSCRRLFPGAGSTTTSTSGSATRRTTRPGTCCAERASALESARQRLGSAERSRGPGKSSTSPRGATGSGGTATTTRRPRRPVRRPVPPAPANVYTAARRRNS